MSHWANNVVLNDKIDHVKQITQNGSYKNNHKKAKSIEMSIETKEGASDSQVVSKQRVADHGEVLTAKREVDAMLDLVKHETDRIESRFLEPACGTGNFLAEVLDRKLAVVTSRYGKSEADWDRYAIIAVSSIYGIDILPDNIEKCRERLFKPFEKCRDEVKRTIRYILEKNMVCGI